MSTLPADDQTAPRIGGNLHSSVMFGTTLIYLAVLAVVVQWWNSNHFLDPDSELTVFLLVLIWVPFVLEALTGLLVNNRLAGNIKRFFLVSVLPPFRLGYSTFRSGHVIWLPFLGTREKNQALFDFLERRASVPMIVIALMILPVLGIEFVMKEQVAERVWLGYTLDASASFIWFAFTLEFVVMVSVAEDKFAYCKKHWLNILIILMPLLAFLRGFQVIRAFNAARSAQLMRVYRVRGLLLRMQQALVALSAVERLLFRNPERHLKKLVKTREEKERELESLLRKIERVEAEAVVYRARREALKRAKAESRG